MAAGPVRRIVKKNEHFDEAGGGIEVVRQYEAALAFAVAQGLASLIAMVFNYRLNNIFTYRDQRLHGLALATDMLRFIAICSVGAGINLLVAIFL